jgi:hypothetical protein
MIHPPDSTVCYNCGAPLNGPFCAACGQKAQPLSPSLHDLVHDFTHEMLHVDGRIFRSVTKLLFAPGFLTLEHFAGRRARWVSPLRLYLIFSLIYFAAASLGGRIGRVTVTGTEEETSAKLRTLGFQSEAELQEAVRHAQKEWAPRVMFVLVPLCAWLVQIACRRAHRNYPQHLLFSVHVHAALFAAGALATAARLIEVAWLQNMLAGLALLYGLVYVVLAFRNVYGGPIRRAVLRAALVGAVYFAAILAAVAGIVVLVIFRHH